MSRKPLIQVLIGLFFSTALGAQTFRLANPVMASPSNCGWMVDPGQGSLRFSLPVGQVPGEIAIPVALTMNGAFQAYQLTQFNNNAPYTQELDVPIFGTCGFGYIGVGGWMSGSTRFLALEDGRTFLPGEFSMQSQGSSLLGGYGFTNSPAYTVNSDGTMLWSTPTIAQGSPLPFTQGLLVLSGLPVGYTFNLVAQQHGAPLMQYHLVADKNLLRVYVEVLIAGQNIGLPVLWADRFGHYVTFQWTQVSSGLPTGITSMVRVDALNQRSQGVTLRYANWSDTTIVHDLMRIDFVNFSGPAALIQGYSGYASQEPSAFVGPATSLHPAQSIPAAIGGMISRPRYFTLGDPYSVAKPSWNNQGAPAGTQPTLPPTNSGLASIVWTLTYDANLAEIENIVSQTNVTTDFSYGNYSLYSPNCNLPLPMLLRGITQTVETDNSQSTPPVRIRSWVRSLPATTSAPWTVTYTDYWSSVGSPDRTTTYTYSPMSNPVDYGNGFLLSEVTADNNNVAWSTITSTSSTTLALGGGGLDNSLSMPATVAVARNNENPTNTTYTYLDGTALQIASITRQILMNGTQTTFLNQQFQYNPQWPMLEANQVNQVKVTRTNLATGVAQPQGTLTTSQVWDQANLLELQNSYCNAGAGYQHGQSFSYTSDGKH